MILKFIFELETNNGVVEKILIRVAKSLNLNVGLSRDIKNLYAFIEGNEEELDNYSRELAKQLPLSIFLKSLNAEVVDEFKDDLDRTFPKINLPPCPKCLNEVKNPENENYYNPFHYCEVCGYNTNEKLKVKSKNDFKRLFENLANKLKKEGRVYIQTMNGTYEVTKNLENVKQIVAVDLAAVATYFMSFEGEAKALASIEKPLINLKTNLNFKKEFGISIPSYLVKLPDCMVLELLCEEIKNDIKLIGLKKSKKNDDFSFEIENSDEILKAVVTDTDDKDILIENGDRGLLPKFEEYIGEYVGFNGYFKAVSKDNKTTILKSDKYNEGKSKKVFAGFFGVVNQWKLHEKNIMGFCFYKEDENKILINSPKFGLIEYIDFKFKYKSYEEIFAEIKAMNETGAKLIDNFSKKEPKFFENAINSNLTTKKQGISYLWGLIGIILGFSNNIDDAYEKLLDYANSAMTKKGPRIDYKMDKNNLNPLWAIRTAMSFKLAGVDNYLLSFGVIESFSEFLSNVYEQFNKETELDGAVIVGDLFEGELLNKIYTYIKKNYSVFTPKALPISGAIESYGDLIINSKNASI